MRGVVTLAILAAGCSIDSAGLDDERSFTDGVIEDTGAGAVDTSVPAADSAPIVDTRGEDSVVEVAVDSSAKDADAADAGCGAPTPTANPCSELTRREQLASGQTMDGRADDFCDVPYVDFNNWMGVIRDPSAIPTSLQSTMRVRAAWSSFGLHLHLSLRDDKIQVAPDLMLWQGDSAEIYVAGYDALTGAFDNITKDVGAHQIIFAPSVGATPTRAVYFYGGTARGGPPLDRWFARNTGGGYDLEVRLPWGDLKPTSHAAPTAGKRVALTFGFNQKQDAQKAFAIHQVKTTTPFGPCSQPYCDDRLWCTPILNP